MPNDASTNTPITDSSQGIRLLYLQQELILPEVPGNYRCWQFARHWTEAGHHITFITGHHALPEDAYGGSQGSFPKYFERDGIGVHVIKTNFRQDMRFARRLFSYAGFLMKARKLAPKLKEFDAVLAYSAPLSVGELGRQLAAKLNKPLFFELADVWPDVPIGMGVIRPRWIQNWLYARTNKIYDVAEKIFTFSKGMRGQVISHGVPEEKVMTVPNGINLPALDDASPASVAIEPDESRMRVFYTGTLGTVNNVSQLVRAFKRLEEQGREDVECFIVGRGNESEKVQSLAQELNVRNVNFIPRVPRAELPSFLTQADVGVSTIASHPVLEHNAATKFYDYLSSGIPVVINHEGWQAEYLRDNDCGLSSTLGDVEAFAANLAWLADHPDKRKQMGENARTASARDFDRADWANKMMNEICLRLGQERVASCG